MSTSLKPLYDRVLVQVLEAETKTAGGLFLPETRDESDTRSGHITSVGKGRLLKTGEFIPLELQVGNKVLFNRHAGVEIDLDGIPHVMIREMDVLGVL